VQPADELTGRRAGQRAEALVVDARELGSA
jgi:hypothetical protein